MMAATNPKKRVSALEAFDLRFDEDEVATMERSEWEVWVDRLPRDEFLAMIAEYGSIPQVH
jgi:hypothetical protein